MFGLVFSLGESRAWLTPEARFIVLVGFMGAFTTFSSYAFDTHRLALEHSWGLALANMLAQNLTGLAAVSLGLWLGR